MIDSTHARQSDKKIPFKTFPEFTKLTLKDKAKYEQFIADFPPLADISFPTLMIWWDFLDTCAVAELNGNLVISYWFPGVEKYSGLSIVGNNKLDESLCTIFDYLRSRGEVSRMVHVPEFVVSNLRYPDLFIFKDERGFDEYIMPTSRLYPLSRNVVAHRRWRLRRILAELDKDKVLVKSLDLEEAENRTLLLESAEKWWQKNTINDLLKLEREGLKTSVSLAESLGMQNICLYVDGEFIGFCLYFVPSADPEHAVVSHVKVNCDDTRNFDTISYFIAKWLADRGIMYLNLEYDLGLPFLRVLKLSLGPTTYFRKYTVEPVV